MGDDRGMMNTFPGPKETKHTIHQAQSHISKVSFLLQFAKLSSWCHFFLNRFSFNEMMSGNNCRLPLPPNPPNPNPSAVLPCGARMDLAGHHWPTVHRSNFPLAKSIDLASNALDVERTNQIDKMTYDMTYDNWHFEFSLKSQKADLIQWCICLLFVSCCFEIKDQFSNFSSSNTTEPWQEGRASVFQSDFSSLTCEAREITNCLKWGLTNKMQYKQQKLMLLIAWTLKLEFKSYNINFGTFPV